MRRLVLIAGAAALALAPLWPAGAASAEPRLTVSSIRQEAGYVEFYLSGSELSSGVLDQKVLTASVDGQQLQLTARQVAQSQGRALKRSVALVIDTSGSMSGAPLAAAKNAASAFLDALPADVQVAIVTAGSPSIVVLRTSADRAKVKSVVAALQPKGETALFDAIRSGADLIRTGFEEKRIIVLSDGADTASAATYGQARSAVGTIPVDTIAFNTEETAKAVLTNFAKATGGRSYQAGDAQALTGAFAQAAGAFSAQLLVRVTVPPALQGKEGKLVVQATVGETTVTTDFQVTFVPDTQATTPLVGSVSDGVPVWLEYALPAVIFVGLLALGILIVGPLLTTGTRRRRLSQVDQFAAVPRPSTTSQPEVESPIAQAALQMSQQVMQQTNVEGRLAQQLDRAGMRMRPHEWLLLRTAVTFAGVLVCVVFISPWYLGLLLGVIAGWGGTAVYHRIKAIRRVNTFADQLPDALQLVIGSLRSGFSLTQSVDAMTRELGDPIQTEFGRALGETRLGVDIEDALDRVAKRMRNRDLAFVVVAIRVQREIGGNLAEVLATTVHTMRERATLHRQVRALSAEGRLSAYVLIALPIVMLGYMILVRGTYLLPLIQTPTGLVLATIGAVELILGTVWMLQAVKVEV